MQNLKVIFEDNHIIVVEKPVNIPSQADKTGDIDMLTIIKAYLKEKYNKPGNVYLGLVHRLDRPVGGVMVFAKTSKSAGRLSNQVREKQFQKTWNAMRARRSIFFSATAVMFWFRMRESTARFSVLTVISEIFH